MNAWQQHKSRWRSTCTTQQGAKSVSLSVSTMYPKRPAVAKGYHLLLPCGYASFCLNQTETMAPTKATGLSGVVLFRIIGLDQPALCHLGVREKAKLSSLSIPSPCGVQSLHAMQGGVTNSALIGGPWVSLNVRIPASEVQSLAKVPSADNSGCHPGRLRAARGMGKVDLFPF